MTIIVCVDDNYGMMFNNRRQSRDKNLYKHILELTQHKKLFMNLYSEKLFSPLFSLEENNNVIVCDNFLDIASEQDYCFVENEDISKCDIEKIILYRWNRVYPADVYFEFPISKEIWKLQKTSDIKGNSHDVITEEVYINE